LRLLLDTHTLLWWLDGGKKLSSESRAAIANPENEIFVSAVSAWEIVLKKSIGKLRAPANLDAELQTHEFTKLPILFSHISELEKLPWIHKDPFDRILLAQSVAENLRVITRDPHILAYPFAFVKA
jgi:PIN domain nuclease of toxin-antitoxin system